MNSRNKPIRVLYSFPHKLGAERTCYTAVYDQGVGRDLRGRRRSDV